MADETRDELGTWARECGGYFMRSEQGDAGKLVRLDRVRRWLMASDDGLPYGQAGEALMVPLEELSHAEIETWLYLADEGNNARLVRGSDDFLRLPVFGLDDQPSPENCGVRGALRHMRGYWCERPGNGKWFGQEAVEPLAVPVAKAQELWGWGSAVTAVHAVAEWTGERLHQRSEELKRQGVKDYAQRVAKEAGIVAGDPAREVRRRIKACKDANKASPLPNVRVIAGKRSA